MIYYTLEIDNDDDFIFVNEVEHKYTFKIFDKDRIESIIKSASDIICIKGKERIAKDWVRKINEIEIREGGFGFYGNQYIKFEKHDFEGVHIKWNIPKN